jgi:hypothetical protein
MHYHTSCGAFGFGKSDETTCNGKEDTHLSKCDGFLGSWMGSTVLKCPKMTDVVDTRPVVSVPPQAVTRPVVSVPPQAVTRPVVSVPPPTVNVGADTHPPPQNNIGTTYCTQSNSVLWSDRGEDIYVTTGLHIPAHVTQPWNHSNMNGTQEECEMKCDKLESCQGFSFAPSAQTCWFKRTSDLSVVDASDTYDFVYKCTK